MTEPLPNQRRFRRYGASGANATDASSTTAMRFSSSLAPTHSSAPTAGITTSNPSATDHAMRGETAGFFSVGFTASERTAAAGRGHS